MQPARVTDARRTAHLSVRALSPADELAALEPVWGEPLTPGDAALAPLALVVLRGRALAGLALGRSTRTGRRIDALFVGEGESPGAVLAAIAETHAGERIELIVPAARAQLSGDLERAGFEILYRRVSVACSLTGLTRPARRPLTFRRYADVGRRGMLAVLAEIWAGGAGPMGLAPELELDEFLDLARPPGGAPDTSLWRVAYHAGEPAGAALALRLAHDQRTAVLLYIGVHPRLRGRGLGRALHGEALWMMRSHGATRYEDSTAVGNVAMRRIFARAGCEETGSSVLFVRPAATEPTAAHAARPPARLPLGRHVSLLRKVPTTPELPHVVQQLPT